MVYSVVSQFSVAVSQFFHCCPIKLDRRKKIRLGYRFRGGRVCFLISKPPQSKSEGSGGASDVVPRRIFQSFEAVPSILTSYGCGRAQ